MQRRRSGSSTMTERVAINTGPLVALARMAALEIAGLLPLEFVCPREVQAELQEGARRGHIPVVAPQWLRTQGLKHPLSLAAVVTRRGEVSCRGSEELNAESQRTPRNAENANMLIFLHAQDYNEIVA